ncbi:hypothetical protein [Novosphingobium sp. 9U]|uniref:hypothetical protein n=1 Tax=Novosphingobium sp. 9U TaxID=2653158 RepID=UPI0012F3E6DC|nr:hypothetical protein [Novosphingobium sp. 9U]VWX53162.1 hypothetical protein NOVOSPHI9U_420405 [Novosphingobium sp. 9U]
MNAVVPSRHFAHAHHWGIKAALAELPLSSNPYRTPKDRAAWVAGYHQASAPALIINR